MKRFAVILVLLVSPFSYSKDKNRTFSGAYIEEGKETKIVFKEKLLKDGEFSFTVPTEVIQGVICSVSFPKKKNYIEIDCMSVVDAVGASGELTRYFTRIMCDGKSEGRLLVNRAKALTSKFQNVSIFGVCKN